MQVLSASNQHVYSQLVKLAGGDAKMVLDILAKPLPDRPATLKQAMQQIIEARNSKTPSASAA